ncbi:hypothetical protein BC938DRAFT_483822, partial [Jimgerdemannia flammicorona]
LRSPVAPSRSNSGRGTAGDLHLRSAPRPAVLELAGRISARPLEREAEGAAGVLGGPRICIGKGFFYAAAVTIAHAAFGRFRFELKESVQGNGVMTESSIFKPKKVVLYVEHLIKRGLQELRNLQLRKGSSPVGNPIAYKFECRDLIRLAFWVVELLELSIPFHYV